jgi:hypothetical protein
MAEEIKTLKFAALADAVNENFKRFIKEGYLPFRVTLNAKVKEVIVNGKNKNVTYGEPLFITYINAMGGLQPVDKHNYWRSNNEHACQACCDFINKYGTLVFINPTTFDVKSLFSDLESLVSGTQYQNAIEVMNKTVLDSAQSIQAPFSPNVDWVNGKDSGVKNIDGHYRVGIKNNQLEVKWGDTIFNHYVNGTGSKAGVVAYDEKKDALVITSVENAVIDRTDEKDVEFDHFYVDLPDSIVRDDHKTAADYNNVTADFFKYIFRLKKIFEGYEGNPSKGEAGHGPLITKEVLQQVLPCWDLKDSNGKWRDPEYLLEKAEMKWIVYELFSLWGEFETVPKDKRKFWYACKAYKYSLLNQSKREILTITKNNGPVVASCLLVPMSIEGKSLKDAIKTFNMRVDASVYGVKSSTKEITRTQLLQAQYNIEKGGWDESLLMKYASAEDLKKREVKFYDCESKSDSQDVADAKFESKSFSGKMFAKILKEKEGGFIRASQFEKVQRISIFDFLSKYLSQSEAISMLLEAKHEGNRSIMTCARNMNAKSIFKWPLPFDIINEAGTAGKSRLKSAAAKSGSFVGAPVSAILKWLENVDLDLHLFEIKGDRICYDLFYGSGNRIDRLTSNYASEILRYNNEGDYEGMRTFVSDLYEKANKTSLGFVLDQDVISHRSGEDAIENIFSLNNIQEGQFLVAVHAFSGRDDFEVEVNLSNISRAYEWKGSWRSGMFVPVVLVNIHNGKVMDLIEGEDLWKYIEDKNLHYKNTNFQLSRCAGAATPLKPVIVEDERIQWGLKSGHFYPVEMICPEPKFWGEEDITPAQWFFAVQNMRCDHEIRAWAGSHLNSDFIKAVGGQVADRVLATYEDMTLKPESSEAQLAGMMFSPTMREEIILKCLIGGEEKVFRVFFGSDAE